MNLNLSGKVVIISGGAKGIGQAISLGCAAESAIPVMLDRDGTALSQMEEKLTAAGHRYGAFQCELTEAAQCERAIQSAAENFGKIDALATMKALRQGMVADAGNRAGSNVSAYLTRIDEEIEVFEETQNGQVADHTDGKDPLAFPFRRALLGKTIQVSRDIIVNDDG